MAEMREKEVQELRKEVAELTASNNMHVLTVRRSTPFSSGFLTTAPVESCSDRIRDRVSSLQSPCGPRVVSITRIVGDAAGEYTAL
jgi:hypothetical protein